jgi:hypothetical protein
MSRRDADQLVADLRRYFHSIGSDLTIEKRGGHWHVVRPNGQSLIGFESTPSDHRFRPNAITRLRRKGIIPPDWRR